VPGSPLRCISRTQSGNIGFCNTLNHSVIASKWHHHDSDAYVSEK